MYYELTPASQRVLAQAARWWFSDSAERFSAPALLLGLLAESECRAALLLEAHGISEDTVREHWPTLQPHAPDTWAAEPWLTPAGQLVPELVTSGAAISLAAASERLQQHLRPLQLATEHLLLGLAAAQHPAAAWLRERGFDAAELEAQILQPYGVTAPVDFSDVRSDAQPPELTSPPSLPGSPESQTLLADPPQASSASSSRMALVRILDAAANRAHEGLRVLEDYVRFALDDRHLTDQFKQLRHELTAALAGLSLAERLAARETQADVGTELSTAAEYQRADTVQVLAANFSRLQESLRSLEEYGKVVDRNLAVRCERIRYRVYTLQRALEHTRRSVERLATARVYVLIDGGESAAAFEATVSQLLAAGVDVVQLRDKRLDDRQLLQRARRLRERTREAGTLLIVNDRPDLAILSAADGVHVGQEELSVKDVRALVGPAMLIGVSTHSLPQARQAVLEGADYLGVGPVFPSATKSFAEYPGLAFVQEVAQEIRLPAFAIGGITAENLPAVAAAGLRRVAVSGVLTSATDPTAVVRQMRAVLER